MNYFKKLKIFLIKEDRKVFSLLFILIKIFLSLLITLLLPILFLAIFIFKEPREINSLNQYINTKISNTKNVENFKFEKANLSLNKHFDIVYSVKDLDFKVKGIYLNFPKIDFRIKIWDLIFGKFFLSNVAIEDVTTYLGYDGLENNFSKDKKISNVNLKYEEITNIFDGFIDYFNENNILFFNNLTIKNSSLYFFNKDTKNLDKIEIIENDIRINKNFNNVALNFNLKTKINNKNKVFESLNNCIIKKNKDIDCEIKLNNLSIHNLTNFFDELPNLESYIKNVKGSFNVTFNIFIKNCKTIENSKFTITSPKGNFNLKQFFGDNINYKNFVLNGYIKDNKSIDLNNLTAELFTDKNKNKIMNFIMSSEFENKDFLKLNFDIANAGIDELYVLWPVFLDDLGIRDWVVEHFKSGLISKATASLLLNYDKNDKKLKLEKVDSEVNINNAYLDYSELFPPISNMDTKAIFTDKYMKFYINKAKTENIKISNGTIYTDFTSDNPSLLIDLHSHGDAHELFYFIDYKSKDKIKSTLKNYLNGQAEASVKLDIPFNNLIFKNVLMDIKGNIKNNNTFLFSNNSNIGFKLLKNINSNKLLTGLDLTDSFMDFSMVDFVKKKTENLGLNLDINIFDNEVTLENIKFDGKIININGTGTIKDGDLKGLYIDNVIYGNNDFNFEYIDNNDININIYGEKININKENNKNTIIKNNFKIDKKINFDINFNDLIINKKYDFVNINILGSYSGNKINNIGLTAKLANNNLIFNLLKFNENSYQVNFNYNNIGDFLNNFDITNKVLGGDLYIDGTIDEKFNFKGNLKIKNDFNVITKDLKNAKFYNYILNSNIVTEKFKHDLKSNNTMNFDKVSTEIYFNDDILRVKKLLAESSDIFGFGISCGGKYYLDSGKFDFEGLIAPLGKLNTLFGVNKIPVINKILFGKDKAGLFTVGYSFKRESVNNDYEFNLIPISTMNSNSLRNLFLLLLLI